MRDGTEKKESNFGIALIAIIAIVALSVASIIIGWLIAIVK